MIKKMIAFLCVLAALLLCFVSCNNKTPGEEIVTSDLADYTIVYSKNCDSGISKKANVLALKLQSLYGVTLNTGNDEQIQASEKEILVGYTNRAESREFIADLRSEDYGYAMVGKKICIAGANDEYTTEAIDSFMTEMLAEASKKWELDTPNVTRSEYEIDDLRINGKSIKGWTVAYTSENQNSEKEIAEMIRNKIVEISDFVPFFCTDKDNITEKVINVSVSNTDAKIEVSENRIDISGRDTAALLQATITLLGKLSDAPMSHKVIRLALDNSDPLDEDLTVMSFNLRYKLDNDEGGIPRAKAAVAQIRDLSPDVLGVQEDSTTWYEFLDDELTEYTGIHTIAAGNNEFLSVYYKTALFTKVKSGLFWLSDTPNRRSKYSESLNDRGMNYVVLERKSDGKRFCFVNTHLENESPENPNSKIARQKQVNVLLEQTAQIVATYGNVPSIIVGDFNSTIKRDATIHEMIRGKGYVDCSTAAFSITARGTWNDAYNDFYIGNGIINKNAVANKNSDTLDFCYVSKDSFFISTYNVSADKYNDQAIDNANGLYTSDHFPIVIKFMLTK